MWFQIVLHSTMNAKFLYTKTLASISVLVRAMGLSSDNFDYSIILIFKRLKDAVFLIRLAGLCASYRNFFFWLWIIKQKKILKKADPYNSEKLGTFSEANNEIQLHLHTIVLWFFEKMVIMITYIIHSELCVCLFKLKGKTQVGTWSQQH